MNAFKAGLINSQCCNHFPFTQLTQCHWLQTVDVQDRSRSCTPCSGAASRAVPPPHVSTPPRTGGLPATRVFTARAGLLPARRALTYARALRMTLGDIRFGPPSLLRSQPVVLSAPSTGARLRRVPPISPFQTWRRASFHSTDHSGHAGRIGQGSWRLPVIRSSFRRGS